MARGILISLIHHQTLAMRQESYQDNKAIALMSSDVSNVEDVAEMVLEAFARVLELTIGISLLAWQVGWLWPLPLGIIFCASYLASPSALSFGQLRCSLLAREPLRGKAPQIQAECLERCYARPPLQDQLGLVGNQEHQDARCAGRSPRPHPRNAAARACHGEASPVAEGRL